MNQNEMYHFGVKGMHWGVRRYQNEDGSLKSAGKRRYQTSDSYNNAKAKYEREKSRRDNQTKAAYGNKSYRDSQKNIRRIGTAMGAVAGYAVGRDNGWSGKKLAAATLAGAGSYNLSARAGRKIGERAGKSMIGGKAYKTAKRDYKRARKQELRRAAKETKKDLRFYSSGSNKYAAKKMVDKGMSKEDAVRKTKRVAWRNTAVALGAYAAANPNVRRAVASRATDAYSNHLKRKSTRGRRIGYKPTIDVTRAYNKKNRSSKHDRYRYNSQYPRGYGKGKGLR